MVISDLNYNFAYNFSIAAVVFGNGANITGPFSDIFAFSFRSGIDDIDIVLKTNAENGSIRYITFSIGGIVFLLIVILIILSFFCTFR